MSDFIIKIVVADDGVPEFDVSVNPVDMTDDNVLETAVIISLFTDRLAEQDDLKLMEDTDRRGWWADALPDMPDNIGSRLYLLGREKQMQNVLNRAREYAEEALKWLIDDGVASHVQVQASIPRNGWLKLAVQLSRPNKPDAQFDYLWEALNAA